jgi:transposase InsO family protein
MMREMRPAPISGTRIASSYASHSIWLSFNGKFRDECLAMEWFRNRIEAKVVIEDWRVHYNEVRPHSSLNYQTPNEFRRSLETSSTTGAVVSRSPWS